MKAISTPAIIPVAESLYLRPVAVSDAPVLFSLIDKQRPYLRQWLPFVDASREVGDTEMFLQYVTAKGNIHDKVFVIMYQHEVSGLISFKAIDYQHRKLEIGYYLSEQQQGKGIMLRSCQALVNYAFEMMDMNRIQIKVGVGNLRSSNIPQKLGFTLEGVQREAEFLNGRFHDLELYSLLQREWQQRP
ncbi:GNAT family N-acetyltransferase [Pontibacter sp. 172403-2]|uniref:GNAT family N-acetyltransferase n=1 Tax=Pontibacter rufus TaxID=2791028 RepID=UPI0018AFC312|nr:GNAT family N-acetyltransferase [Pontibacter sp. 172403-2]MBF9252792.1 GNAT family N-acetyltransferase [Pontibacter sp. 172403-2]